MEDIIIKSPGKVKIVVNKDSLSIKRKGFSNAVLHGFKGEKTIPFKNITSIQLKEPRFTSGYIQFSLLGGGENKGGLYNAMSDENTITVANKKDYRKLVGLKELIEDYNRQIQPTGEVKDSSMSAADEILKFKNLLDEGIITEEEFNRKKKELLG